MVGLAGTDAFWAGTVVPPMMVCMAKLWAAAVAESDSFLTAMPSVGGVPAIKLLKALLTDLLIVENNDPIDLVNAELEVISVTRTVSTPSIPLRIFVSFTVLPDVNDRLFVTVCARSGGMGLGCCGLPSDTVGSLSVEDSSPTGRAGLAGLKSQLDASVIRAAIDEPLNGNIRSVLLAW
jgi:hypothetical protein